MPSTAVARSAQAPEFSHFITEIWDRLQQVTEAYLESDNEHQAFVYLIAELYETTSEDRFVYSDGPNDGGIDFFVRDSPSYTIGQCKCPDLSSLETQTSAPKFDRAAVNELVAAIDMLRDRSGEYDVKTDIKRLRGDYQRDLQSDQESARLTAILAILGELTGQARSTFEARRSALASEGVHLRLVEWTDIYQALHALDSPADIDFRVEIHYDEEQNLLRHSDYCYVLAHASDFYHAFGAHEWNLFEWNVRYQMFRSAINRRIVSTLQKSRGRKFFHHYNNGLLMTCRTYRHDAQRRRLIVTGPQIVNGCQTVRAICEAYDSLTPNDQSHFDEHAMLQVKLIKTTDPDFIGELVISTNDQNPMKPRNLKSNSSEQRDIQRSFRTLPKRWFYQRKDGEFESLCTGSSRAVRWFRKSDYSAGRRRFRLIDNEELAKAWYAFIGHSESALRGGVTYFDDEPHGVYRQVFESALSPAFWSAFSEISFTPDDDYFESGQPSVYQYLLSVAIARYVDSRRVSFRTNKADAIRRGIEKGRLRQDPDTGVCTSTSEKIDEYLTEDEEYFLNIMINNMREVLIELFSFVLCRKHVECDARNSQRLLTLFPHEAQYLESGFSQAHLLPINPESPSWMGAIYEFLYYCMKQYYFDYQAEIRSAPRLKSYLAQRNTVDRLRESLIRRNDSIRDYDVPWKTLGKTFIESLPEIPGM